MVSVPFVETDSYLWSSCCWLVSTEGPYMLEWDRKKAAFVAKSKTRDRKRIILLWTFH